MIYKILLSGDGGQGIQTMSHLICTAAFNNDLEVSHIPNYGLEQRGGVSLAYIKISDEKIVYPKFSKPDLLLVMSMQARNRTDGYKLDCVEVIDADSFEETLKEKGVSRSSWNIFFLGVVAKKLEEESLVKKEQVFELLKNKLNRKPNWEENQMAFDLGYKHTNI